MPAVPWRLLHLLALSTMAIGQPLLSLLGGNPTFFTAHRASPGRIVIFAIVVVLAPALLAGGLTLIAHGHSALAGARVHLGFVATFLFLFALQVVDVVPGPAMLILFLATAATVALHWLYRAYAPVRSVVSLIGVLPVAVVALFVFTSPTNAVIFPDAVSAVALDDLLDGEDLRPDDTASTDLLQQVNERFPPIHLLVFDELPWASLLDRGGTIDAARFPNFARLGAMSHVFANTTTVALQTERAVPALMTGRSQVEAAPVYSLYPESVFTLLGGIYDMTASDPLVDLCPPTVCNGRPPAALADLLGDSTAATTTTTPAPAPTSDGGGGAGLGLLLEDAAIVFGHLAAPDGLELGLPSIGAGWGNFGRGVGEGETTTSEPVPDPTLDSADALSLDVGVDAGPAADVDPTAAAEARSAFLERLITDDTRVADMRAEIAAIDAGNGPTFDYLHVLLPHVPWRHHWDGSVYADIELPGYFDKWNDDEIIAAFGLQRHLLQLQFTDQLLGAYLDRLDELGTLDRSTIVVTADHGVSFVAGQPSRGVGDGSGAGIAGVPLLYKLPGQTAAVWHDAPTTTLDIVPTLAGQLGITPPWELEGYDLLVDEIPADRARIAASVFDRLEIHEPFPDEIRKVTSQIHATFGDGASGSLYALAGSGELIGEAASDHAAGRSPHCWVLERPTATRAPGGEIGYVFGSVALPAGDPLAFAVVVDGVVAGTAHTMAAGVDHRVFALGDPRFWAGRPAPDVELHELVDDGLAPLRRC